MSSGNRGNFEWRVLFYPLKFSILGHADFPVEHRIGTFFSKDCANTRIPLPHPTAIIYMLIKLNLSFSKKKIRLPKCRLFCG